MPGIWVDFGELFKDNLLFTVAKMVFSRCKTNFTAVFLEVCSAVGMWHKRLQP